jgi:hypothetical protein
MKRYNRFRPRFEMLETRLALAVAVTTGDFDGNGTLDIRILGDAAGQRVLLDDNESSLTLSIDANGDGDFTDAGDRNQEVINGIFETFDIQLGEGSDSFTFNAPTTDYTGATKSLVVDLGKQADHFLFNAGVGRDLINSSITIDVAAGGGSDHVSADFGTVSGSAVSFSFDLLGGNDGGNLSFLGNITGGSVLDIHGDLGVKDNFYTTQLGSSGSPIKINNSSLSLDLTGGSDVLNDDRIQFDASVQLENGASLLVKTDLGSGDDECVAFLNLQDLDIDATSLLRYDVTGEDGNDNLQMGNTGASGANTDILGVFEANIGGGAGSDSINVQLGTIGVNANMDLDGTFRTRLSGGSENDVIRLTSGTDASSTGILDAVILGNAGNDTLAYNLRDEGNVNFGPAGFALVDGGLGTDSITSSTSGAGFDASSLRIRNGADPTGTTPGVTTGDFDGNGTLDLRFVGTDAAQNLTVRDDPVAGTLTLELDLNNDLDFDDPGEFDEVFNGPFETVYLQMLGGVDVVSYVNQAPFTSTTRSLLVDLGKQADSLTHSAAGGGTNTWTNSAVTLEVTGSGGRDNVAVDFPGGGVSDSVVSLDLDVGNGPDLITLGSTGDIASASTVDVRAALGTGAVNSFVTTMGDDIRQGSTVQFQVAGGNVAAERDEVRFFFERTGSTTVPIALLDGSRLFFDASLQAGDDFFLAEYQLNRIDIDAASSARTRIKSGEGDDFLQVSRSSLQPPDANTDIFGLWSFDFAAGLGDDVLGFELSADAAVPTNALELDGTLRYRGHGGGGNDVMRFELGTASVSTGKVDAILQGGLGNDELVLTFVDNGNETFPPAGFLLLDGGLGTDTVTVNGSGAGFDAASVKARNLED